MERFALIMAGGAGLRLWPLSRKDKPKQFICAGSSESMLIQTIRRLFEIVKAENCFVITSSNLKDITRESVKDLLPESNIIPEPERKNTAACIAYACLYLKEKFGEGLLCCVPADGYVKDTGSYKKAVERAYFTAERHDSLVIIGIVPTAPATGYGYIKMGPPISDGTVLVDRFVEKPNAEKAAQMIADGGYLWNSGILVGKLNVINENIRIYLPDHFNKLSRILLNPSESVTDEQRQNAYHELTDISFDVGVLEKCDRIYAVEGSFDWDDIGSLDALSKTQDADAMGNTVVGRHFGMDTYHSVVYSKDALVATIGIRDMIIACSKDAVIVCPRDRAQDVKLLVQQLNQNGYESLT